MMPCAGKAQCRWSHLTSAVRRRTNPHWEAYLEPSRTQLAVLNNVRWYEAMFDAHGLTNEVDRMVWLSHEYPPPFHSNLVVLSPATSRTDIESYVYELEKMPRPPGWSLKDSFACLDLSSCGFAQLFEAQWMWRDPLEPGSRAAPTRLDWARVATGSELTAWENGWWGDARNESASRVNRQFPDRLLASHEHIFVAGRLDGRVLAGGIANCSPGVVGISNVFSPSAFAQETWSAITSCVCAAFPNTPLVGYERGTNLQLARGAGFTPIGPLRVWCRAAGTVGCSRAGDA